MKRKNRSYQKKTPTDNTPTNVWVDSDKSIEHQAGPSHPDETKAPFKVIEGRTKFNKKFNAWEIDYKIEINDEADGINNILEDLMARIRERKSLRKGDKIELIINNTTLYTGYIITG
jgi:hypothetical protein